MPRLTNYTDKIFLTPTEAAYLAGIVDGEGSLHMSKCSTAKHNIHKVPHYQATLTLSSTDKILIDWLHNKIGGSRGEYTPKQTPKNSRKKVYRWSITGCRLKHMCEQILPYLVIKIREAEIIIKFRESVEQGKILSANSGMNKALPQEMIDFRDSLYHELKSLHCRGYCSYQTLPSGYHS